MKRQKRWVIIGFAVVFLLAGILVTLLHWGVGVQRDETQAAPYIQREAAPTSVAIQNQTGKYSLQPLANTGEGSDGETVWSVVGYEDLPQYQNKTAQAAQGMQTLSAEKIFSSSQGLASYGLEAPCAVVEATYPDGSVNRLQLGNTNPGGTGRYARLNEEGQIALLSLSDVQLYLQSANEYVDCTIQPYIAATDPSGQEQPGVQSCTLNRNDLSAPICMEKGADGQLQILTPAGMQLSEENQTLLQNSISNLTAASVTAVHPTAVQCDAYGLNQPQARVEYTINGQKISFSIGNRCPQEMKEQEHAEEEQDEAQDASEESYYLMLDSRPVVYTVRASSLPWITMQV